MHSALGSQRQRRLEFDAVIGRKVKGEALADDCRDQSHLHRCEVLPDADASTPAERQICRAGPVLRALQEPVGIEGFRVGPPARVVVNVVDWDDYRGAAPNAVSVDDIVLDGAPCDDPGRGEVALRFKQTRGGPRQPAQVVGARTARAQHVVHLGEHPVGPRCAAPSDTRTTTSHSRCFHDRRV